MGKTMKWWGVCLLAGLLGSGCALAQVDVPQAGDQTGQLDRTAPVAEKPDPMKRRLSDRDEANRRKNARAELKGEYKKWLNEDVVWIITPEEETAFKNLTNDEERDQFIEQFWLRRNPNPESPENEFREQHYLRHRVRERALCRGSAGLAH